MAQYSIGIDFGTLSVRAVLANTQGGHILGTFEFSYPHKIMHRLPDGTILPDGSALAHPADYIDGLRTTVREVVKQSGVDPTDIVGIGLDCTSCSVIPLGKNGMPLCLTAEFENHADAYIKLWKHHTPSAQAERLQAVAQTRNERFLEDCGNRINCESFFPKVLETFERDREVYDQTYAFMEVGEWLALLLTGNSVASETMATFKRFYHPFRGYPSAEYFESVQEGFGSVVKEKLHGKMLSVGESCGKLHPRMAEILRLHTDVAVALPAVDAHAAVPACGGKSGDLICIMGTSGVSLMVSHNDTGMDGIYSAAGHSFLPDVYGHEGGQCSVGDTLAWFCNRMVPPDYIDRALEAGQSVQQYLTRLAEELSAGQSGLLALDWNNGVRTPLMDYTLSSAWIGMTNRTKPEEIYRALLEGIALGTRRIKEIYENHGHTVLRIFCLGGVAQKNALFCQILADVFGRSIEVCPLESACALGSAVNGAIAADPLHAREITEEMCCRDTLTYSPRFDAQEIYQALYKQYIRLSDCMSGYESIMRQSTAWRGKHYEA